MKFTIVSYKFDDGQEMHLPDGYGSVELLEYQRNDMGGENSVTFLLTDNEVTSSELTDEQAEILRAILMKYDEEKTKKTTIVFTPDPAL